MGQKAFLIPILALLALALSPKGQARSAPAAAWPRALKKRLLALEALHPGQLGVYVKDLQSGEALSFHGDEPWYLASGVKLPIALETLRQVDQGILSLEDTIRLREADKLDGAGGTNHQPEGALLSIRYLIEQMLIQSDNTASDLLLSRVGIDRVNALVSKLVPQGFGPITSLSDVRRRAYANVHPAAARLTNRDFLALRRVRDDDARARALTALLKLDGPPITARDLSGAYSRYYASRVNSGTLQAYGELLERVSRGEILKPGTQGFLMRTLARVRTGRHRIRAGLPPGAVFAHKTGTQRARFCDSGIIEIPGGPTGGPRKVVVAACTQEIGEQKEAEALLRSVGEALTSSGIFGSGKSS